MKPPELIQEGLRLIQTDPRHDLRLGFRCRLWDCFDQSGPSEVRRRRRVKLVMLTVEKVLPLWQERFTDDRTPQEALELAAKALDGTVLRAAAKKEIGRLWTHCDNKLWKDEEEQAVIMVGYGAIQAISEAVSDRHPGCEKVNEQATDFDIEPYTSDAAFFSAAAYSGGAPWEPDSDRQKRLYFWTWWLTSAVPESLSVA